MTTVIQATSKTFVSQGLELHYLDWGNDGAPTLIFIHGMYDHARSWDWVARALREKWHVIAPDLRGHGDSEWSPDGAYHMTYYLQDLTDLVDALGSDPVSIVAHSMGGNPAARFAALYPARVRKLVLVDAMGPNAPVVARWAEQGVVKRSREWLQKRRGASRSLDRRFPCSGSRSVS
jgi:pimeloyl-ACP methyl ester carboxylesterase